MNWVAFRTAFGRMLLWMLGILFLIHLITWVSPEPNRSPVVPDWTELVVWSLFILPVVPAMNAAVAMLHGSEKWRSILLGVIFGIMTPVFGIASLVVTFLVIGGNVDLWPRDESISLPIVLAALFITVIALGVGTALTRQKAVQKD